VRRDVVVQIGLDSIHSGKRVLALPLSAPLHRSNAAHCCSSNRIVSHAGVKVLVRFVD
jgi:hypothetical protein